MEKREGEASQASELVKEYARGNRVELQISEDAFQALMEDWKRADLNRPAEISFVIEGREVGNLKIAACAYWGDTCCA
jgi:hypothetical protein